MIYTYIPLLYSFIYSIYVSDILISLISAQLFGDVFGSQNTMSESLRLTTERLVQESEQQRLQQLQQQQQEVIACHLPTSPPCTSFFNSTSFPQRKPHHTTPHHTNHRNRIWGYQRVTMNWSLQRTTLVVLIVVMVRGVVMRVVRGAELMEKKESPT